MEINPIISVILTSYNHERYIRDAIESILGQTYQNFELIIIDDNSTDNTMKIINGFNDPRIITITQNHTGPSMSFNEGLIKSRGDYIAFMSGDDISLENRLEIQLDQIKSNNADIIFSQPTLINSDSEILENSSFPVFFSKSFNSTAELYRLMFYNFNFFCAPSAFCKRDVMTTVGLFKRSLIQLQDFDYWIRACKKEMVLKVFTNPLIKYRIFSGENLSNIKSHQNRLQIEMIHIFEKYFSDVSEKLFVEAFEDDPILKPYQHIEDIQIKGALLSFYHPDIIVKIIGAKNLINLLDNSEMYEKLISTSHFTLEKFFSEVNNINISESVFTKIKTSLFAYQQEIKRRAKGLFAFDSKSNREEF